MGRQQSLFSISGWEDGDVWMIEILMSPHCCPGLRWVGQPPQWGIVLIFSFFMTSKSHRTCWEFSSAATQLLTFLLLEIPRIYLVTFFWFGFMLWNAYLGWRGEKIRLKKQSVICQFIVTRIFLLGGLFPAKLIPGFLVCKSICVQRQPKFEQNRVQVESWILYSASELRLNV